MYIWNILISVYKNIFHQEFVDMFSHHTKFCTTAMLMLFTLEIHDIQIYILSSIYQKSGLQDVILNGISPVD